jgi:hypothetical protein
MAVPSFDGRAAMRRPKDIARGLAGLGGAALLVCFIPGEITDVLQESRVHHRFAEDVPAHIAHALAGSGVVAFLIALATWLVARSLRLAFGLPRRQPTAIRRVLLVVQSVVGAVALMHLCTSDASEYMLRLDDRPVLDICVTGFIGCLLFAYDVPRLLANARGALTARKRLLLPFTRLDALPQSGVVHTEGVSADPVDLTQRGSFMVSARGATAIVEIDPERVSLILDAEDNQGAAVTNLPAGTAMRIVAAAQRESAPDAVYRGALPLLLAPDGGPLRIFVGEAAALRRLLVAGAVEVLGAVGLTLSDCWFVASIAYVEVALRR